MEGQLQALNMEFEKWKGALEQIDDVCLMGVKIQFKAHQFSVGEL